MSPTTEHFPPASRPDERFDAVVARGEHLRRQDRRTRRALGVAAVAVVAAVVVGLGALATGGDDRTPTAGPGGDAGSSTTVTTATTVPDRLTVVPTYADGAIEVEVVDPHFPVSDTSELCVRVALVAPATPAQPAQMGSGSTCWHLSDPEAPATVGFTTGVVIDCGAVAVNPEVPTTTVTTETQVVRRARFVLPEGMPPGSYVAKVTAVSSPTNACETSGPDDTTTSTATIEVHRP